MWTPWYHRTFLFSCCKWYWLLKQTWSLSEHITDSYLNPQVTRVYLRNLQHSERQRRVCDVMSLSESCCFCQSAQIKYLNGNLCFCSSLVLELKTNSAICNFLVYFLGYKQTFQFGQKHSNETSPSISLKLKSLLCSELLLSEVDYMIIWCHYWFVTRPAPNFNISVLFLVKFN